MDGLLGLLRQPGAIPRLQQLPPLRRGQDVDHAYRLIRAARHRLQHGVQIAAQAMHASAVEQGGGIAQHTVDGFLAFDQFKLQIELHGVECDRHQLRLQAGQCKTRGGSALPGEHHLEQRCMLEPARWIDDFHHLFERQVLMLLCGKHGAAHAREQFRHAGLMR
jgi:hypothetical protein